MKTNLGIAIFVGWMTQLGLSTLLPTIAIVFGRAASMLGGGDGSWGDHAVDPREPGWHLIQAFILLGSVIAAWLTGYLIWSPSSNTSNDTRPRGGAAQVCCCDDGSD